MNQYVLDANILFSGVISQKVVCRTLFSDRGNGLQAKGYSRIKLFNDFLAQQLNESGREEQ